MVAVQVKRKPQVLVREPHPQSHAALYQLNDYFRHLEFMSHVPFEVDMESFEGLNQFFSYKNEMTDKGGRWKIWLKFRRHYFRLLRRAGTKLSCWHCGRGGLISAADNNHPDVATLDHFLPRSKGGKEFCHKNLVVSCGTCNWKRGSMTISEFRNSHYYQNLHSVVDNL